MANTNNPRSGHSLCVSSSGASEYPYDPLADAEFTWSSDRKVAIGLDVSLLYIIVFSAIFGGCGGVSSSAKQDVFDLSGSWDGTSVASCAALQTETGRCNAENRINLMIAKSRPNISGSYSCAFGNMICRGANDSGKIVAGKMTGPQLRGLRIELADGSSCIFDGILNMNEGRGTYECFMGAGVAERGRWRVHRSY